MAIMAASAALLAAYASERAGDSWWAPGSDLPLPAYAEYDNPLGRIGLVNTAGTVVTDGHLRLIPGSKISVRGDEAAKPAS